MRCTTVGMSLGRLLVERNAFHMDPPYQRESGVWSTTKQQLFIDSLLNELDVPKIYLHDLQSKKGRYDWAVIDGKQRLSAVWNFLDDRFPLDPATFKLTVKKRRGASPSGGMKFSKFTKEWSEVLKSRTIDMVRVEDASEDDIEDLFSRLNNGEPLNAAEKRNAMGGVIPTVVREVAKQGFFAKKVPFANTRYQHYEVAAKFLLIEEIEEGGGDPFCDLKKKFLDDLVHKRANLDPKGQQRLIDRVITGLKPMNSVFSAKDPLLNKQAYLPMYYLFLKLVVREYAHKTLWGLLHNFLEKFQAERLANLQKPEDDRDPVLIEYGRLVQQGTNDRESLRTRVSTLRRFLLQQHPDISYKDPKRAFSDEERFAIWIRAGKHCEQCQRDLPTLEEMEADHQIQHAFGGATTIANSRSLCGPCNVALAQKVK